VLAAALGVPVSAVSVAQGASSRQKLLRVTGDAAGLMARVTSIFQEWREIQA
jgi:uncharacterized protein YggU (UPF0235/DUF167 family)